MTTTEKLDKFISEEGNGSTRDALNVALARLDAVSKQFQVIAAQLKSETERAEYWKDMASEFEDKLKNVPTPN